MLSRMTRMPLPLVSASRVSYMAAAILGLRNWEPGSPRWSCDLSENPGLRISTCARLCGRLHSQHIKEALSAALGLSLLAGYLMESKNRPAGQKKIHANQQLAI
jgi:hypothetical protein